MATSKHPNYQRLEPGQIRLLTITPQHTFSLAEVSLSDDVDYAAISYCWEPEKPLCKVRISEINCDLRLHVFSMLCKLERIHSLTRVWLDMLCINQDDEDEKSQQVSMIGEIFKKASRVYAWLGDGDTEIDRCFDTLRSFHLQKQQSACRASFDSAEALSYHRDLFRIVYLEKAGRLPEKSEMDDEMLVEEFNWLRPLYSRPYWTRVWIVQELVLATAVTVCCGDKSIDLDSIYGLSLDWGSFEQGFDFGNHSKLKTQSRGWSTIQTIRGHRRRREVSCQVTGQDSSRIETRMSNRGDVAILDEIVMTYALYHRCTYPKDRVYGFRELIPEWKAGLVVDYRKSNLEVYTQVAKLGIFKAEMHGGYVVARTLWRAMEFGAEDFDDFVRGLFPDTYEQLLQEKKPARIAIERMVASYTVRFTLP